MGMIAAAVVISYLLGAIPFGVIFGKAIKGIDLREVGSGNIGAANAFRALGFWGGLAVLVTDVGKGTLGVLVASLISPGDFLPWAKVLCGIAALVGHNYSCFLGFKGGKGIATSLGVLLALSPKAALSALACWGILVAVTKYSSLGSIVGACSVPVFMVIFKDPLPYRIFGILAALFALYKHKANIQRLIAGTELKIDESPAAVKVDEGSGDEEADGSSDTTIRTPYSLN
jgi:glycerol-3-phosphate acyltransferase PlsY